MACWDSQPNYTEKNEHFRRSVFVMGKFLVILSKLLISTSIVDSSLSHNQNNSYMRRVVCKKIFDQLYFVVGWSNEHETRCFINMRGTHRSLETRSAAHRWCASYNLIAIFSKNFLLFYTVRFVWKFPSEIFSSLYRRTPFWNVTK